jgi:hypothetical protein
MPPDGNRYPASPQDGSRPAYHRALNYITSKEVLHNSAPHPADVRQRATIAALIDSEKRLKVVRFD